VGEDGAAELADFVETERGAGARVTPVAVHGDVEKAILDSAEERGSDLLVMGTHGRRGFERWVLGSLTEKVLRKAWMPVLTVSSAATLTDPGRPFQRILCSIDFTDFSRLALTFGLAIAEESRAAILLLHVLEAGAGRRDPAETARLEAEASAQLLSWVPEETRRWCQPELRVAGGKPYREVLQQAQDWKADLVVVGAHGTTQVDHPFLGANAGHVVRAASCPVLTVRF
jgi:nucleotide-binding universal stress UspA family protein